MPARVKVITARLFPHGPVDVVRQVLLFAVAYYAYRLTRGWIDDGQGAAVAFENARHLINIEQSTHLFFERDVQSFTGGWELASDAASLLYMNAQVGVTLAALVFIYLFHNERFYFVRNMFMVSMALALAGYTLFPTAPPRFFFAEYGFQDTVSQLSGIGHDDSVNALFNPYAAVPSMHCCFAIFVGFTLARSCKHRAVRIAWALWPLVMTWVVVSTANHWIADALLGAATAGISFGAAVWLARVRPAAWSFSPVEARATA
jgi:PAP2 superfamily